MTYKHLTTRELTLIADFGIKALKLIGPLNYFNVVKKPSIVFIVSSITVKPSTNIFRLISDIKRRCGRKRTQLPTIEVNYIHAQIKAGWTPDTIIGRDEHPISCSMRTLYRMFARNQYGFSVKQLPMKGKRHPNGYVERRGKAGQLGRSIYQRYRDFLTKHSK